MLPKLSVTDSIEILRRRYPGALVCTTCARLIASTPARYANSNLTPEQVETYVCAECRCEIDPARSKEISARIATAKATAAAARLRPPLARVLSGGTLESMSDDALIVRAAEAVCGRRVAHDYFNTCATNGHHRDLETLADCPHPSAAVTEVCPSPAFCEHARPADECIAHAKLSPATPMPAALARCPLCLGYHGKDGRDRCPYNRPEADAVKAARKAARQTAQNPSGPPPSMSVPTVASAGIDRHGSPRQQSVNGGRGARISRLAGRKIGPKVMTGGLRRARPPAGPPSTASMPLAGSSAEAPRDAALSIDGRPHSPCDPS